VSPEVDPEVGLKEKFAQANELAQMGKWGESMVLQMEVARGLEQTGKEEKAGFAYRNVVTCYEKGGFKPDSAEADVAARAELKLMEPDLKAYLSRQLAGSAKDQQKQIKQIATGLKVLEARLQKLTDYGAIPFLPNILLTWARLYFHLADALRNAPLPDDLPQEEDIREQYRFHLGEFAEKFESKGVMLLNGARKAAPGDGSNDEVTRQIEEELKKRPQ